MFLIRAEAQSTDTVISPTIPFDPPNVPTTTTPSVIPTPSGPSITVSSDRTQAGVGDRVKVSVNIDTKGAEVREYSFNITFNPGIFRVVDANTTTSSTVEISFLDTFFQATQNESSQQNGTINVAASTDLGSATISNRTVAEFELEAIAEGFSEVQVVTANSLLVNTNSINILESGNSISFTVTSQGDTSPTPITGVGEQPIPSTTPSTALLDGESGKSVIVVGLLLIASGFYIWKQKNREKVH
ncbi:hypothetical protein KC909_04630 [Candidatus Dojkabacteria bacterium]|uniref:Cohesin domain-containing protein n=1 Tax=Candidatus Dojkabacteria bacterium TaxID=2099670 RepID=A0A955L6N2_9BACT|nr:hypothetical protein [Candidatus Dojkabacteria bacterium]